MKMINKSSLLAEIERRIGKLCIYRDDERNQARCGELYSLKQYINTLEVKEEDLMLHTIISECCDWLAMNTNLSHDKIEGCRNLMLTVKDEQLKAQKGEINEEVRRKYWRGNHR